MLVGRWNIYTVAKWDYVHGKVHRDIKHIVYCDMSPKILKPQEQLLIFLE